MPERLIEIRSRIMVAFACAALLATTALLSPAETRGADGVHIPSLMFRPSVNLVLSINNVEKSKQFYGDILQLEPMANLNLPGGFVMTRYQVGTTEIKFLHRPKLEWETGDIEAAHGIRLLTLFFVNEDKLEDSFAAHGRAVPVFEDDPVRPGWKHAIISDPDGNRIELVAHSSEAPESALDRIEVGLNVADVENSARFYGDFVQFERIDTIPAPVSGEHKSAAFRYGNTTIKLWQFPGDLPNDSGRWEAAYGIRYIQYVVRDLDAVDAFAKSSGVTIDREIFPLGNLARIMFVADPDGVINEFVGLPK